MTIGHENSHSNAKTDVNQTVFELTFQTCLVKSYVKKLFVLVLHEGPQRLGLKDRIF